MMTVAEGDRHTTEALKVSAEQELPQEILRVTRSEAQHILGVSSVNFERLEHWDASFPKPLDEDDADVTYSAQEIRMYRDRISVVLTTISNGPQKNGTIITPEQEPVFTIPQMAAHLNVSYKTINRWTRLDPPLQGTIGASRGRLINVLTEGHLRTFAQAHPDTVTYASSFTRLTDIERGKIISQAFSLSEEKLEFSELIHRLSEQSGRSVETIRAILRNFMLKKVPSNKHLSETKALSLDLAFIPNEEFARLRRGSKREQEILAPMPEEDMSGRKGRKARGAPNLDFYLKNLYEVPLLTPDQERHLFRKMNFLKYRAQGLQEKLQKLESSDKKGRQRKDLAEAILATYRQVEEVRNAIITANLRLVVNIAKRYMQQGFLLGDLVSDGNQSLMRAVEGFDFARGNKFSTYASWAIQKNFSRTIPNETKRRARFFNPIEVDSMPEPADTCTDPSAQEANRTRKQQEVSRLLACLDHREQTVIRLRYGLGFETGEGIPADEFKVQHTLGEIGVLLGVTKERIRQIETRAKYKMARAAQELKIEEDED